MGGLSQIIAEIEKLEPFVTPKKWVVRGTKTYWSVVTDFAEHRTKPIIVFNSGYGRRKHPLPSADMEFAIMVRNSLDQIISALRDAVSLSEAVVAMDAGMDSDVFIAKNLSKKWLKQWAGEGVERRNA